MTVRIIESMRWNACVHILDLSLYSRLKEFIWGNGVRTHVNSKGKLPSTRGSEEGPTCDAAPHRTANPTHYRLSYSSPHQSIQSCCCRFLVTEGSSNKQCVPHQHNCFNNCMCCHTETEATDQIHNLTQFFSFSFCVPSYISGVHHFWWDFCVCASPQERHLTTRPPRRYSKVRVSIFAVNS